MRNLTIGVQLTRIAGEVAITQLVDGSMAR